MTFWRDSWIELRKDPSLVIEKFFGIKRYEDGGTLWAGPRTIIHSVFKNRKTAVPAGHAMSKDWTAALLAILWLLYYWPKAKVVITAPTLTQVKDILFKEIETQYSSLCKRFSDFDPRHLTTKYLEFSPECFVMGMTTKETNDKIGKFSGRHSPNMLVIMSEAQAIESSIYRQVIGLMTSENSRLLELGNPLVPYGEFYEHCTQPRYGYHVIKLPVSLSPNIVTRQEVIPGMVSQGWVDELITSIGSDYEDDPEYQARALAEFPQQSLHAWIPLNKIRAAVGRTFKTDGIRVGGLDVAGPGKDETVCSILDGQTMTGQKTFRKMLTPEIVGNVRSIISEEQLSGVAVDYGYDPGVTNWLDFEGMPVVPVGFGKGDFAHDKYENRGTMIWAQLRDAFMNGQIGIIDDPVLVYQLASRRIERLPSGKIKLESKKKTGKDSPDRADALALGWHMRMLALGGDDGFEAIDGSSAAVVSEESEKMERVSMSGRHRNVSSDGEDGESDSASIASEASNIFD